MNVPPSSYEMLVAYADGQLDRSDRELVLTLLDMDDDLNREVWELRKLKDMVALSYEELPQTASRPGPHHRRTLARLLSGAVLLLVLYLLLTGMGGARVSTFLALAGMEPPASSTVIRAYP